MLTESPPPGDTQAAASEEPKIPESPPGVPITIEGTDEVMYVKPSEKAQKLDPQVATLVDLLRQAMEPTVGDADRNKLSDQVYTLLEGLLPVAEPKMDAGQLQIWAQIQNLHKTMDQAAALLEQYQKEIPEMQSQLLEQNDMESKMEELSSAMDMLTTKVNQVEDKTKVGLPVVRDFLRSTVLL